jgi:hypothetical protein
MSGKDISHERFGLTAGVSPRSARIEVALVGDLMTR